MDLYNTEQLNENYFTVLTDGLHFWVSMEDMQKICTQISVNQLEELGVKMIANVINDQTYINVNDDFLIYVQKNTKNPKYVPTLSIMMSKTIMNQINFDDSEKNKKSI